MINGHLSEAKQGFALLNDVDEATFVRFIRWTYNGEYPAPEYTWTGAREVMKELKAGTTQKGSWADVARGRRTVVKEESRSKLHTSLKESFISEYDYSNPELPPGPRRNRDPHEDYTEVFLAHARLYVFAEKYDIQPLKKLCYQKLQRTLAIYTLYPERVGDITSLLKYVYANTAVGGTECIRTMLAHYVGAEMDTLNKYGDIKDLMWQNEDILGDFLMMFASKIS